MNKRRKPKNQWLMFSSLAFQIAIIIWGSVKLGKYFDNLYPYSDQRFVLTLSSIGTIITIWVIYRQSKNFW